MRRPIAAAAKVLAFSTMSALNTNFFELFGLVPRFNIDMQNLESSFLRLQAQLHPDRHSTQGETEKLKALQLSTLVNEGYRTLRNPGSRAHCLISLAGKDDNNTRVSQSFLLSQLEWRESIQEARAVGDVAALEAMTRRLKHKVSVVEKELASALDELSDFEVATQLVNQMRFYEKLRAEISDALDVLES